MKPLGIDDYIDKNLTEFKNMTAEICRIPSMTGSEEEKARYIRNKIFEYTKEDACIDEAGNVIYIFRGKKCENRLLLAAHIDTVFRDLYDIKIVEKDGRLYAPSIMDNSVNAAGLLFMIKMFRNMGIIPEVDILFAFTVGEEGTGNLKGIKHVTEHFKDSIREVVCVDCNLDTVVNKAVGSKRYEVSFKTKGGHSWSDFGNKNAILYAARLVENLYNVKVPASPKTTYNAGIINGGTSINTIAEDSKVLIDLRSEDNKCLNRLDLDFLNIVNEMRSEDVEINVRTIGDRPCGCINENCELLNCVIESRRELGLDIKFVSASTDSNIPLNEGIPAVTFGVCRGGGTHTKNEFLYMDSLEIGMKNLAHLIMKLSKLK